MRVQIEIRTLYAYGEKVAAKLNAETGTETRCSHSYIIVVVGCTYMFNEPIYPYTSCLLYIFLQR